MITCHEIHVVLDGESTQHDPGAYYIRRSASIPIVVPSVKRS